MKVDSVAAKEVVQYCTYIGIKEHDYGPPDGPKHERKEVCATAARWGSVGLPGNFQILIHHLQIAIDTIGISIAAVLLSNWLQWYW